MRCFVGLALLACSLSVHAEDVWLDVSLGDRPQQAQGVHFDQQENILVGTPSEWEQAGLILSLEDKKKPTLSSKDLGLSLVIDDAMQTVKIKAPARFLPVQVLNNGIKQDVTLAPMAKGLLLGYDIALTTDGKTFNTSFGHTLQAKLGAGSFLYSGQANFDAQRFEYLRGFTTWSYNNPESLRSVALGDLQTKPLNAPFQGVLMAGVKIARDPTLTSEPLFALPVIGGVATDPSQLQAVINGIKQESQHVEDGRFEILNPGLSAGYNATNFVLTDKFGRQTVISNRTYFSPTTFKKGLSAWEVNLGLVRSGTSDTYLDPAMSVSYSRGLSDRFSVDFNAEATKDARNVAFGLRTYNMLGAFQASVAQSEGPKGKGKAWSFGYAYNRPGFSLSLSTTRQSDTFWDLSQQASQTGPYNATSLSVSKTLGHHSTLALGFSKIDQDSYHDKQVSIGYDYFNDKNAFSVGLNKSERDASISLSYTRRFGANTTAGIDFRHANAITQASVKAQSQYIDSQGDIVRLNARLGEFNNIPFGTGTFDVQAPKYDFNARLDITGNDPSLSLNYASGLWIGEGVKEQAKPQSGTIGVVKVPGVEGVPVYLENQFVGKTNKQGVLIIGPMRSLEANQIRIDARMLPPGYDIAEPEIRMAPNRQSVALIEYKPSAMQARSFKLQYQGKDVPVGKMLTDKTTMIGYDGEVYLDDPKPGQTIEVEGLCKAQIPDPLPSFAETPTLECK